MIILQKLYDLVQHFISTVTFSSSQAYKKKGQIIDPKCYLGIMNPSEGKPHHPFAINCIKGGIMPAIVTENDKKVNYYILIGKDGKKVNNEVNNQLQIKKSHRNGILKQNSKKLETQRL